MSSKRCGEQTVKLKNPPKIIATYSIVGPKEGEGPLASYFDTIVSDDLIGKDSFEKAEIKEIFLQKKQKKSHIIWGCCCKSVI